MFTATELSQSLVPLWRRRLLLRLTPLPKQSNKHIADLDDNHTFNLNVAYMVLIAKD